MPTQDSQWCRERLPQVSRTFAIGIAGLPEPLQMWVTVGYLLCRVADTVEDAPALDETHRQALFGAFEHALHRGDCAPFLRLAPVLESGPDGRVCRGLDRVLAPLDAAPDPVITAIRRHVGELASGMARFAASRAGSPVPVFLGDQADLDDYCHVVAGTVGQLLTALFCLDQPGLNARRQTLEQSAGGFARLLQLTNIVKDVAEDWQRGVCFLPASALARQGVPLDALLAPEHRTGAMAAVQELVAHARTQAADAQAYLQALGSDAAAARRFCRFPLALALQTLDLAADNPAVLQPGVPVKVGRAAVAAALAACIEPRGASEPLG